MARKNVDGVVRKRSLIEKTRKHVMLWVAGSATLLGVVVVIAWMIIQVGMFNHKVLGMKQATLNQIEENIEISRELKADINLLNTDENLLSVRTSEEAEGLQTILDALPADGNKFALGASLQQKILQLPGVSIEALSVDSSSYDSGSVSESGDESDLLPLDFTATISGTPTDIRNALIKLESSIRAVDLKYIVGNSSGNKFSINLTGQVYYYPPADLDLGSKVVKE